MHNSDAISILICACDSPCFVYIGGGWFFNRKFENIIYSRLRIQTCFVFLVALFELQTPETLRIILEFSIAGWQCLCVSGKVVLWSKHFDIRVLVPMLYVKLCNHKYIYIYIYTFIYIYIYKYLFYSNYHSSCIRHNHTSTNHAAQTG